MLRTSRQRKVLCRLCPVARTADIVGDSVSLLILRELLGKPRGFTEIELTLGGVSSRTICEKLKCLIQGGLITRIPKTKFYPRVDYHLTSKGKALRPVIEAMRAYGKRHLSP